MKQLVGINLSSRNRPDILSICLHHLYKFLSRRKYRYVISVVNDAGDPAWDDLYTELTRNFPNVQWYKCEKRLGIANTKNVGIKMLREKNCDHFFMFDDDSFPVQRGWEDVYIKTARQNNVHHLMHQFPLPSGFNINKSENGICEYPQCFGVLLYFTRHAIDTIGGYRKNFSMYGLEHVEISHRCNYAGLQPNWGPFISPEKARDYIYSLDLDFTNCGKHPPGYIITSNIWRSSVQGENVQPYIDANAPFLAQREPVFEEI